MDNVYTWAAWCHNNREVRDRTRAELGTGTEVHYFAAVEVDRRGLEPFSQLRMYFDEEPTTNGRHIDHWTFSLDDGRTSITTPNRLRHITMGQNLAAEYATSIGAEWLLFVAADTEIPNDIIPRLLEVNHPLVGAEIPTYCLTGPRVPGYPFPVEEQLISAACIFIRRDVFKVLRWRADPDAGMSDDPAYRHDAQTLLGIPSYVRKDCVAHHYPETIGPIETRFPGRDTRVYR